MPEKAPKKVQEKTDPGKENSGSPKTDVGTDQPPGNNKETTQDKPDPVKDAEKPNEKAGATGT